MDILFGELRKHIFLNDKIIYELKDSLVKLKIAPRTKILQPFECQQFIIFILNGIARNYYKVGDKECTSVFSQRGDFVFSLDNIVSGLPCQEYIESCTELEIIKLPKEKYDNLLMVYPEFKLAEKHFINKRINQIATQLYDLRLLSASERYSKFLEQNKQLSRQLQLQYIATYLDITPFSLSRIRREFKSK